MNAATTQLVKCALCGGEIPSTTPVSQCPRCLLNLGLSFNTPAPWETSSFEIDLLGPGKAGFDFDLMERIGRGGMGIVYRARQRSLNRIVALKMIAVGELASPAALARFRREAETAAKLDHPNIVAIYEVGERDSNPFLVMRLIEGGSLAERLHEFTAYDKIAGVISTVARAVHYAHERGALHRDLKPSNILLDLEGNPHLTDFGIAKLLDQEDLTLTSELLGTPSYMSPEQAAGKPISRAADIYSLGAILYELLTGRAPFAGGRPMEILRQVLEEDPPPPVALNPNVNEDLATICLKALDKDPSRRYVTALELAEDLDRCRRRESILAREAGAVLRLRRWTARNPAVATLIASLTIGMVVTLGLLARANDEKNRKSIALDILRTESARQLQEIWKSADTYFSIKSETLAAMAGMELATLAQSEQRFTIALVAEGNPLYRVLSVAPMLDQLEESMTAVAAKSTRLDLRLYKDHSQAIEDMVKGEIDFLQINPREFIRARARDPKLQPLITLQPAPGFDDSVVIFTRDNTGIKSLADLNGRTFLLGRTDSMASFWTKVSLVDSGIHAKDLGKYRYIDGASDFTSQGGALRGISLGNPFSAMTPVEAVVRGAYDAAVVKEKRFREVASEQQLVALHRFKETGDLIAARGNLPPETARSFQQALLAPGHSHFTFLNAPAHFCVANEEDLKEIAAKLETEAAF